MTFDEAVDEVEREIRLASSFLKYNRPNTRETVAGKVTLGKALTSEEMTWLLTSLEGRKFPPDPTRKIPDGIFAIVVQQMNWLVARGFKTFSNPHPKETVGRAAANRKSDSAADVVSEALGRCGVHRSPATIKNIWYQGKKRWGL